jgi:hypothetical protein
LLACCWPPGQRAAAWPSSAAAISLAHATASRLGYTLNRGLNFRSHGAIGPQVARYAAAVAVNYLAIILGVTDGLAALGAPITGWPGWWRPSVRRCTCAWRCAG